MLLELLLDCVCQIALSVSLKIVLCKETEKEHCADPAPWQMSLPTFFCGDQSYLEAEYFYLVKRHYQNIIKKEKSTSVALTCFCPQLFGVEVTCATV